VCATPFRFTRICSTHRGHSA